VLADVYAQRRTIGSKCKIGNLSAARTKRARERTCTTSPRGWLLKMLGGPSPKTEFALNKNAAILRGDDKKKLNRNPDPSVNPWIKTRRAAT